MNFHSPQKSGPLDFRTCKQQVRMYLLSFGVCMISFSNLQAMEAPESAAPNVVFIYIDDLGYSDVGFLNSPHYKTPHIDRLAAEGMTFTNAYAAAPNCAPSRACLMSGQYSPRHGVYTVNNSDRGKTELRKLIPIKNKTILAPEVSTLGELFQKANYKTAYFGKWHLGKPGTSGPQEQGFEFNFGGNHTGTPKGGHFSPYKNPQLADKQDGEYLTDRLTQEATGFIEQHHGEPFMVFLSHYAVHTPIQAKKDLVNKWNADASANGFNAKYAAMIESVDQSVGEVMETLERHNLDDNTMVIFYSDNGGFGKVTRSNVLRGSKGMCYEGGIRVPLAIRWNGIIEAGSKCDEPVHGVDFYETYRVMLDGALPENQPLDGVDIMPLCKQQAESLDRALFWHFPAYLQGKNYEGAPDKHFRARPFGVIRKGQWKLIQHFEDNRYELFDLNSDLGENKNLVTQHPAIAQQLGKQLKDWQHKTNAPIPVEPNPKFKPGN